MVAVNPQPILTSEVEFMKNVSVEMIKRMILAEKDKKNNNFIEIPIRQPDGSIIVYRF